jgi:hypothetical protein
MQLQEYIAKKKAKISDADRDNILAYVQKGLSTEKIAEELHLVPTQVAAVRAHLKMNTYKGSKAILEKANRNKK